MKVLVVHRQKTVLEEVIKQFAKWHVKPFDNGWDGLLAARAENFDLILCEQDLSVVTGIEMVRSLRIFSMNKYTPVILLANGTETKAHSRIVGLLKANLLTMEEVEEMENLKIE
jgi:DNA-binding response OmpR family regulator